MGSLALARLCGRVSLLDAVIARASRVDWAPGALPVPNETPVRHVPGQPAPAGTADGDPLPAPVDHRIRRFAAVAAEPLGHPPLPSDCSARRRSSWGVVISRLTRFQGQRCLENGVHINVRRYPLTSVLTQTSKTPCGSAAHLFSPEASTQSGMRPRLPALRGPFRARCPAPKPKPRWNLHLWDDEDWLTRHSEALTPVYGNRSSTTDWLPRYAYFTLVLV